MSDVIYGGLPYLEAIKHLRAKTNLKTQHWDDLLFKAHTHGFTIAGVMTHDLLNDLREAVDSSIANGTTITEFRKSFDQTVKKMGWNFKGKRGWRTRVIFDTNMRTAHMAGKWQQIQGTKKERPYLKYLAVGDERTRQQHSDWHGIVLSIDDPFWKTHTPPNGWGCRCTVRTLTKSQAKKEPRYKKKPAIKTTQRINTRTGEVYGQVPVGIDVGWDHNVGVGFGSIKALNETLQRIQPSIAEQLRKNMKYPIKNAGI